MWIQWCLYLALRSSLTWLHVISHEPKDLQILLHKAAFGILLICIFDADHMASAGYSISLHSAKLSWCFLLFSKQCCRQSHCSLSYMWPICSFLHPTRKKVDCLASSLYAAKPDHWDVQGTTTIDIPNLEMTAGNQHNAQECKSHIWHAVAHVTRTIVSQNCHAELWQSNPASFCWVISRLCWLQAFAGSRQFLQGQMGAFLRIFSHSIFHCNS